MKRFSVMTLGCKVNQCESAAIDQLLRKAGCTPAKKDQNLDIIIINTCTVTGKAAMQSRQAIRWARRKYPDAKIVVTGCYAQTQPYEIEAIPGVDRIVGHADKLDLNAYFGQPGTDDYRSKIYQKTRSLKDFAPLPQLSSFERTRAFLKIQDGCNTCCTYCIVPHARGRSRSMPPSDVVNHLERLVADGYREVVLTGIHIGVYGQDLQPPTTLTGLLDRLMRHPPLDRLRLSSIEPTEVDSALIMLASRPQSRLCPHFHIPLQSGDNGILSRMGRPYTREAYREVILAIRKAMPHAAVGADVMVGFPGEDESAFNNTYDLIAALPLTYLHVFPFSPRKGTPAVGFKDRPPEIIVKERSRCLRELGQRKKSDFLHSQVGRTLEVLIETKKERTTGLSRGLSENYLPVLLKETQAKANELMPVEITGVHATGMLSGVAVPSNN
jgi:threonylcarbamoyladenosine tRNA methylthiotransferase MtaB